MRVQIKRGEDSGVAGFISWKRLAEELFKQGGELKPDEHITHFEIGQYGINYFVARSPVSDERSLQRRVHDLIMSRLKYGDDAAVSDLVKDIFDAIGRA